MSEPLRLFQTPPPCNNCQGTGRVRDRDGEAAICPACRGLAVQYDPCIAAGCDTPAVDGPWCAPTTTPRGF